MSNRKAIAGKYRNFFRAARRIIQVLSYATFHCTVLLARLLVRRGNARRLSYEALLGCQCASMCEDLGATFIKLGQLASTRPDLFSLDFTRELSRLQDQVRPVAYRDILQEVQRASAKTIEVMFSSFDEIPISTASVSQVHRATLPDGRNVAVKIRRPNILFVAEIDIELLHSLVAFISYLPGMQALPIRELMCEFCETIERQCNFLIEAAIHRRFQQHFLGNQSVRIPGLVDEYCCEAMLTMDYIDNLDKSNPESFTKQERSKAAALAIESIYGLVFDSGLIHADLHPGNIFFLSETRIVLLDFGFSASFSGLDQRRFKRFFYGIAASDAERCSSVLLESALGSTQKFQEDRFRKDIDCLIDEFSRKNAGEFEVSAFAARLFDIQRKNGLISAAQFTMAILSFLVFEGVVKQLDGDVDFLALAIQHISRDSIPPFFSAESARRFLANA